MIEVRGGMEGVQGRSWECLLQDGLGDTGQGTWLESEGCDKFTVTLLARRGGWT